MQRGRWREKKRGHAGSAASWPDVAKTTLQQARQVIFAQPPRYVEFKDVKRRRAETESAERDAASAASARAEIEARDIADKNRVARVLEEEAARKAKRDRRYSDRKARQA